MSVNNRLGNEITKVGEMQRFETENAYTYVIEKSKREGYSPKRHIAISKTNNDKKNKNKIKVKYE